MAKYTICTNKRGHEERSLYTDPEGRKYLRLRENGQNSMVSLGTTSLDKAVKIRDEHRGVKTAVKLGMPLSAPQDAARRAKTSVAAVIRRYEADGYPGKRGGKRNAGKHCDGEEARCKVLAEYFNGTAAAEDLDQDGLDAYRTWRCAKVAEGKVKLDGNQSKPKGAGDRTTDLDLNCLNNAYRWGLRKKLIKTNPIEKRAKYHAPSEVTHCREYAPESPEELHAAAGVLFSSRRSESLGWQLLVEGMTGLPAKHWQNGEAPGMDWLPKGAPAWSKIKKVDFSSLDRAAALEFEI